MEGDHDLLTLQRLQLPAGWLKCKLTEGLQNKQNIILNSSMTRLTDFAKNWLEGDLDLLSLQRLQLPAGWLKCKLTEGLHKKQNITRTVQI